MDKPSEAPLLRRQFYETYFPKYINLVKQIFSLGAEHNEDLLWIVVQDYECAQYEHNKPLFQESFVQYHTKLIDTINQEKPKFLATYESQQQKFSLLLQEFKKCFQEDYNFGAIKEEVVEQVKNYAKKSCSPQDTFYLNNTLSTIVKHITLKSPITAQHLRHQNCSLKYFFNLMELIRTQQAKRVASGLLPKHPVRSLPSKKSPHQLQDIQAIYLQPQSVLFAQQNGLVIKTQNIRQLFEEQPVDSHAKKVLMIKSSQGNKLNVYPLQVFRKHLGRLAEQLAIWEEVEQSLSKFEHYARVHGRVGIDNQSVFLSIRFKQERYNKLKVVVRPGRVEVVDALGLEQLRAAQEGRSLEELISKYIDLQVMRRKESSSR